MYVSSRDPRKRRDARRDEPVQPQEVVTLSLSDRVSSPNGKKLRPLDFALLRQRASIKEVLEHVGWQKQSARGAQWRGSCPFHEAADAKSPNFAVNTEKKVYCCHRCRSEGNVLDLWIAICGKPILEAAWDMVDTFGIDPPLLKEGPPSPNH